MEKATQLGIEERVDAAHALFSQHGTAIFGMIMFHVGDESRANDLYQDLFLSVVKHPFPKDLSNPMPYLWRAIANDVRDAMRKQESYDKKISHYLKQQIDHPLEVTTDPLEILAKHEHRLKLVEMVLKYLSPPEAKVIVEKLNYNLTNQEIASKLKIKSRSVARYLCTGIKKLKTILHSKERLQQKHS